MKTLGTGALAFAALAVALAAPAAAVDLAPDWHDPKAVAAAAVAASPELAEATASAAVLRARQEIAGLRPLPMLMGGVQDLQTDLSEDPMMTMYMVGASQELPRPARLRAVRRVAELAAEAADLRVSGRREEVRRDALVVWHELAAADSERAALTGVAAVLADVAAAARARYESGSGMQSEIIMAELGRTELDHDLLRLEGRRDELAARLAVALGLPADTVVPPLHLPHETAARSVPAAAGAEYSGHASLEALGLDVQSAGEELALARLAAAPDLAVEASYGMRPHEKDVVTLLARVEMPFARGRRVEALVRAAQARRDALAAQLEQARRRLAAEIAVARARHTQATRELALHAEVLVPRSRLALESTLVAYRAGLTTLEPVLEAQKALARREADYVEILLRHVRAIVEVEAMLRGARPGGDREMPTESGGTASAGGMQ